MLTHDTMTERGLFWFGGSLCALITTLGVLISWRSEQPIVLYVAAGLAIVVGVIFYALPATRRPIYNAFGKLVYPIQLVLTWILLGIVYFAILTPIAIFLRLRGHDPLNRFGSWKADAGRSGDGLDGDAAERTYWIARQEDVEPQQYFKTY